MVAGRPRTVCPEKEELIELGKDLVSWASEELPEDCKEIRCRFCQWYSLKQGLCYDDWELMIRKPEFIVYYEQAQALLGQKFIDGTVNPSISHRFLRIYSPEVKRDENEKAEFEAGLKAKADAGEAALRSQFASHDAQVKQSDK